MKTIEQIKIEFTLRILQGEDLYWSDFRNFPKDDELRTFICSFRPEHAFKYAIEVDKSPNDETRDSCCRNYFWAYYYAKNVDRGPHDKTRRASYADYIYKQHYIRDFGE